MQIGEQQRVVAATPALQRLLAVGGYIGRMPQQRELTQDDFLIRLVVFRNQNQSAALARRFA
ncbi:hypothetical protein D3C83_198050 [compost metagenome]